MSVCRVIAIEIYHMQETENFDDDSPSADSPDADFSFFGSYSRY